MIINRTRFILAILFLIVCAYTWSIESTHIGSFGCFDDCFNIIGGHFLLQGRELYKEIFFNHQPLGAFVSALLQWAGKPLTLFQLIFTHRIFIALWSAGWGTLLILRFGLIGFVPSVLFALTGTFVFQNRFLSESMIAHPLTYMFLLFIRSLLGRKIFGIELIVSSVLTWFIIFSREPFVPSAVLLYLAILMRGKAGKFFVPSILVFTAFIIGFLVTLDLPSYVEQVILFNRQIELTGQHFSLQSIAQMFLYPVFVLFVRPTEPFHWIVFISSVLFLLTSLGMLIIQKKWIVVAWAILLLGVVNIRVVPVGTIYFDAFHMGPWLLMFFACLNLFSLEILKKTFVGRLTGIVIFFSLCLIVFIPSLLQKNSPEESIREFNDGYANYYVKGEVVRRLSNKEDTIFVERWDDPIYWTSRLPSAYGFSWYTSIMPLFSKYRDARSRMWAQNPPSFYIASCANDKKSIDPLPEEFEEQYEELLVSGTPSCVYVKQSVLLKVSQTKIEAIKEYNYSLYENQ